MRALGAHSHFATAQSPRHFRDIVANATVKLSRHKTAVAKFRCILLRMPTILLIDDFDFALESESDFFEAAGFRVLTASSGREGLELLGREQVDAILTDYEMPYMTGLEVAARARQLNPSVPVVIYSGSAENIDSPFVAAWLMKTKQMNEVRLKIEELISAKTALAP